MLSVPQLFKCQIEHLTFGLVTKKLYKKLNLEFAIETNAGSTSLPVIQKCTSRATDVRINLIAYRDIRLFCPPTKFVFI